MIDQFRKNYDYDFWATGEMVKSLEEMPEPPEKAVKIAGHIAFAKDVWLTRLVGGDYSRLNDPWPPYTLSEGKKALESLHQRWMGYLGNLSEGDLPKKISYTNTQGKAYEQVVRDILVHVVDHGTYHRGQLATLIHQGGGKRPNVGYIGYAIIQSQKK